MKMHRCLLALPLLAAIGLGACGSDSQNTVPSAQTNASKTEPTSPVIQTVSPRQVGHIFIIVLENKGYEQTFGSNSPAPYLAKTLPAQGALLTNFYGIGHNSLTNYIALISGQGPNTATQADCPFYSDFQASAPQLDSRGQAAGIGCVYPAFVPTIAGELSTKGLQWKGYMEDMGKDPAREESTCGRPVVNQAGADQTQSANATDAYAARHNPFVYFHAIVDDEATCKRQVGSLDALTEDLKSMSSTPHYSFISPNLCNDAHDTNCANGDPGGLVSADAFLKKWVPVITASPAYKNDGLLMVIFDEADISDPTDTSGAAACCNQPTGPNTLFSTLNALGLPLNSLPDSVITAGMPGIFGPGGGRTGAVFLSPFIKPGTVSETPYNHYSLLKSVSQLFGVKPLGYANQVDLVVFGKDIFTGL